MHRVCVCAFHRIDFSARPLAGITIFRHGVLLSRAIPRRTMEQSAMTESRTHLHHYTNKKNCTRLPVLAA